VFVRVRCCELIVRFGGEVIGDAHREAVGEEIGEAEDEDDGRGERRAESAGNDGERRDCAINTAVDEFRQILPPRFRLHYREYTAS